MDNLITSALEDIKGTFAIWFEAFSLVVVLTMFLFIVSGIFMAWLWLAETMGALYPCLLAVLLPASFALSLAAYDQRKKAKVN